MTSSSWQVLSWVTEDVKLLQLNKIGWKEDGNRERGVLGLLYLKGP